MIYVNSGLFESSLLPRILDIFSYNCTFYAELIKHFLISYPLKVSYTLKVPLHNNSTVIVVVVAVGVVVAVAVGAVLAVQVTVVAVAVAVGDVVEGVVRVVGLKVGVEAVVAVVVTLREVEIVVGAAMYLQQVKQYGLLQICGMPF